MTPFLNTAVDQANRSQVSIYAIDPRGLTGGVGANRDSLTSNTHALLNQLSDFTGGKAFYNRNDLEGGLRNVTADVGSYYLVGYKPKHKKKEGRFHRIEVRLKRSGAIARYRQGYLDRDEFDVSSDEVMTR